MDIAAPAKINIGLHVLRKRPDGFHDLATVFHRIGWADRITAEPAEALTLTCSDPALPTDAENLCLQAAMALRDAFGVSHGARLHLDKRVPYGAGLGSGSSDAAATLRLLVRLWELDAPPAQLHALAARLGSDVPFFLLDAPAAYATGRGEQLTPLHTAGGGPFRLTHPLAVVVPPVHVSTPAAYGWVTPSDDDRPDLPSLVRSNAPDRWRAALGNDFEAPVMDRHPAVGTARQLLYDSGAVYAALSGSGAAVWGVFADTDAAARAAATARTRAGWRAYHEAPQ
ncbi:4-(cytidine 5'-diphospho)-2-C-methyl-D-erythritol kinase [Salisaeta longa]|uniref:4-(cytidine 5'-diphospho)-2-C-methyl-D-erythritol kinase n=1 Tax=Salisaeta longa TaxID=503170 RepID=UPI0003B39CD2|nr:4-(cytidine 5'-diphospho)-2-C-methyl-D-erythritol kinase [Salisaeta longa]